MKITTIGRGSIGGTLARLWTAAGHQVTTLGRDGGDASDADVVLVAVRHAAPGSAGRRDRPGGQDRHRRQQPTRRRGAARGPRIQRRVRQGGHRRPNCQGVQPQLRQAAGRGCSGTQPAGQHLGRRRGRRGRPSSSSRTTPACSRATLGHWTAPTLRRPSPRCSWRSSMTPMPACSTTASPRQKRSEGLGTSSPGAPPCRLAGPAPPGGRPDPRWSRRASGRQAAERSPTDRGARGVLVAKNCAPSRTSTSGRFVTKGDTHLHASCQVGETGFEPATARPPA